ncbi:iron chaperone [Citricoccus sp. GCM10030269]|uniref:iron chaperone n=1 Tax=Citricoccus sp. GCM10030269 TaxID=3273388 RepID=UPI00361653B7
MATIPDHDSYIAAAPEAFRPILNHLRDLLRRALPDAEEMTACNMPRFRIRGTVVASYAAFSKQVGLYFLAPAISAHAEEIAEAGLRTSKTGVTFTSRKPIPDDLVLRLARASRNHIED